MTRKPHPLAGQTVRLTTAASDPGRHVLVAGAEYQIEDWWQNVSGGSWMDAVGNPACLDYAMRSALAGLPLDDEVVYGKAGPLGYLVHVSELPEVTR
jgi:hypothetical protein